MTILEKYQKEVTWIVIFQSFSETILGDGALILGSDYYFALRGGVFLSFLSFLRIPYEQIVAPTNQTLWKHEKLTSWSC